MIRLFLAAGFLLTLVSGYAQHLHSEDIKVMHTADFELTGNGTNTSWQSTVWNEMSASHDDERGTRFKVLYSDVGIYFLFHNEDRILTATKTADFDRLWLEDVVEVFLWPDTTETIYFEYEISPLNYELPILVPNLNGKFLGWRPWEYEGERKTKHLTHIEGGEKKSGSKIKSWSAEFFIPYALLTPLQNVPPKKGTEWRANMYRIDFDKPETVRWYRKKTVTNFHQFSKFAKMIFE